MTPKQQVLKRHPDAVCKGTYDPMFGVTYRVRIGGKWGPSFTSAHRAWFNAAVTKGRKK
jgi:hypothetical protein